MGTEPVVKGFYVVEVWEKNPKGHKIGRTYHAKSAAEDLRDFMQRLNPDRKYHVTEDIGFEKIL